MLELQGFVEVLKGSGIHVVANVSEAESAPDPEKEAFAQYVLSELKNAGLFELLQARQLIECTIAAFAASNVTKQDILELEAIQKKKCFR